MVDDERPEAEAGRIADSQPAPERPVERCGAGAAPDPRHVIDEIGDKLADHPDRQHFHAERGAEPGPAGIAMPVGNAEFAVAVHRRRPHDIADILKPCRFGLPAFGQATDDIVEKTRTLVGAGQDQIGVAIAPRLLLWRIGAQPFDFAVVGNAVVEDVGGVPGLGDHAVGAHRRIEVVGETDQRVGVFRSRSRIDGDADAVVADFPAVVGEAEAGGPYMPQRRPEETQPGLVKGAEAGEAHDLLRRPQAQGAPRSAVRNRKEVAWGDQFRLPAVRRLLP